MMRSELYRARAADCLRLANRAEDVQRRCMFLNMTACWSALEARASLAEDGTTLDTAAPTT
jgi:hypothetical protein